MPAIDLPATAPHPAKFSDAILSTIAPLIPPGTLTLDPFAGVGRIHELAHLRTVGVEIERRWANAHPRTIWGDSFFLPFAPNTFGAVATSVTYANRFADHHNAQEQCRACKGLGVILARPGTAPGNPFDRCLKCDGKGKRTYRRHTYRHYYGEDLHPHNSATLQWGPSYRSFHEAIYPPIIDTLVPGGDLILNISDHVRGHALQPVSAWHRTTLIKMGLSLRRAISVDTPRLGDGRNRDARAPNEWVFVFTK